MVKEKCFYKESFDMEEFIRTAKLYLNRHEEIPFLVADSTAKQEHNRHQIKVYFFDKLLMHICRNKKKFQRDMESILTYGYIGSSRGKKNGLVRIPERGIEFQGVVESFMNQRYQCFCHEIGFKTEPLESIKVVTHRKNGERIIGVLNKSDWRAVLYGIRSYAN